MPDAALHRRPNRLREHHMQRLSRNPRPRVPSSVGISFRAVSQHNGVPRATDVPAGPANLTIDINADISLTGSTFDFPRTVAQTSQDSCCA